MQKRKITTIVQYETVEEIVDSKKSLKLLKSRGSDSLQWDDKNLYKLRDRTSDIYDAPKSRKKHFLSYGKIINEVLQDPEVIKIWGDGLTYEKDVSFIKKIIHTVRIKN